MPTIQRRKTEMVGSLVVPVHVMARHKEDTAAPIRSSSSTTKSTLVDDLKQSVNLRRRHTEMVGTLIVDAATTPPTTPTLAKRTTSSKWNEPLDEVGCCSNEMNG